MAKLATRILSTRIANLFLAMARLCDLHGDFSPLYTTLVVVSRYGNFGEFPPALSAHQGGACNC